MIVHVSQPINQQRQGSFCSISKSLVGWRTTFRPILVYTRLDQEIARSLTGNAYSPPETHFSRSISLPIDRANIIHYYQTRNEHSLVHEFVSRNCRNSSTIEFHWNSFSRIGWIYGFLISHVLLNQVKLPLFIQISVTVTVTYVIIEKWKWSCQYPSHT